MRMCRSGQAGRGLKGTKGLRGLLKGPEVTPTPNPSCQSVNQQVMDDQANSARCSPGNSSTWVKTGNLGLPKRGAGDRKAWRGDLGVPPSLWFDSEAGPSRQVARGHALIMLRCFPEVHACWILQECRFLSAAKA